MSYLKSMKGQSWLLPPKISDLIPEDHICFLIENFIEALDFSSFDEKYIGAGHPAYHPRILLKILVMGVLDKLRSSRNLSRNTSENVVYMYLAENLTPNFRTISDFRKDNPDLIEDVFKHTISLAKENGMINLSVLSTDGTKVKANASSNKTITKEELNVLLTFVKSELQEWENQDFNEDETYKNLRGFDELSKKSKKLIKKSVFTYLKKNKLDNVQLKKNLIDKLETANEELTTSNLTKVNLTDPESRFMKNKKGKIEFSYNPQITTDENGFILASDVCNEATDIKQLELQVIQTKDNLNQNLVGIPWCFDNGYFEGKNIKFLHHEEINGYIATQEKKEVSKFDKSNFKYNEKNDIYICPMNNEMVFSGEGYDKSKNKFIRNYKGKSCESCTMVKHCTKSKLGIRRIKMYPFEKERNAMISKMKGEKGKKIYKIRSQTVELTFADIKENKNFRTFLTRSLETVKTEFKLVCIASNLRKIWIKGSKNSNSHITNRLKLLCRNYFLQSRVIQS